MMGAKTLVAQIDDGTARVEGDLGVLEKLASAMISFDLFFEVLPGTKGPAPDVEINDFEMGMVDPGHE